jgi:hypothetical protein
MKRTLSSALLILLYFQLVIAQTASDTVRVKGILYSIVSGKQVPPSPGRINIAYWNEKDQLLTNIMGMMEKGKLVATSTIGTATINKDGTFTILINKKEIPQKQKIIGITYTSEGAIDSAVAKTADGKGLRIDVTKESGDINLEKTVGRILVQ